MIAVILSWSAAAMAGDGQDAGMFERRRAEFDRWVARLQPAGLLITADALQIDRVTSEAAYFMYAQRKDHQPHARFTLYKLGHRDTQPDSQHWPQILLGDGDYVLKLP